MLIIIKIKLIMLEIMSIFSLSNEAIMPNSFEVIDYKTEYVYSEKYPENEETVLINGVPGYKYNSNEGRYVKEPITEVIRIGTGAIGEYVGTLTGYGPDCLGCSPEGNVACPTKENLVWSLINDGQIYEDDEFGAVRIVAADNTLFPCGTIIEINNDDYENMLAVVLDTGYTMRTKWRNEGKVYIDLAFASEKETTSVTASNTHYNVRRWGW